MLTSFCQKAGEIQITNDKTKNPKNAFTDTRLRVASGKG